MPMNNKFVFIGIAVGIAAIASGVVYGTQQQQANIPDTAVKAQANIEGSIPSQSGFGPVINKEKWHEDPFGDIAKQVEAANAGK